MYVPVDATNAPNPYLKVAERDVRTPSGRLLTLMNPAYMTRQVHATPGLESIARLTSIRPLNPVNEPDDWEREALAALERGATEVSAVVDLGGRPHARLIRPLRVEASCLKCHAVQGYRLGDLRGGISVTVPVGEIWADQKQQARGVLLGCAAVWLMGLMGIVVGSRDVRREIVEREATLERLRTSEGRLRLTQFTVDHSADAVFWIGADGRFLYVNRAACELLGYSQAELLGRAFFDIDPHFSPLEWPEVWGELKKQRKLTIETEYRAKEGTILPVEMTANFLDCEGQQYACAIARNIADRRCAEQKLREYALALETANRELQTSYKAARAATETKSEFLANMSHEIRTPMTAILGYLDLILSGCARDCPFWQREARTYLETISQNAQLLLQIINDILDLSKIEAGKLTLDMAACSPHRVITDVTGLLRVRRGQGAETGGRVRGTNSGDDRLGFDPPAPDPDQPDRQCDQVHRVGRSARGDPIGRRRPAPARAGNPRERHGDRNV